PRPTERPRAATPPRLAERRPANDDRSAVGSIIYSLQRRPSTAPLWAAGLISVIWALGGFVLAGTVLPGDQSFGEAFANLGSNPQLAALLVAIVLPIMLFLVSGMMIRR